MARMYQGTAGVNYCFFEREREGTEGTQGSEGTRPGNGEADIDSSEWIYDLRILICLRGQDGAVVVVREVVAFRERGCGKPLKRLSSLCGAPITSLKRGVN